MHNTRSEENITVFYEYQSDKSSNFFQLPKFSCQALQIVEYAELKKMLTKNLNT